MFRCAMAVVLFATFSLWPLFQANDLQAQNLRNQRIRKISNKKQSIYFESGIFHNGAVKQVSRLKAIRHSFSKAKKYERVVFDFTTKNIPKLYGHISVLDRKIYLDFFETDIPGQLGSFGNAKFVKAVNFYPISEDALSVEILLKKSVGADIFFLSNPARLVLDLKQ